MVHNNPSTQVLRHGFLSLSATWCLYRGPVPKSEEERGRRGRKGKTEEKDAKKIDNCQVKSNTFEDSRLTCQNKRTMSKSSSQASQCIYVHPSSQN